jgi:hypothetical protein
MASAGFTLLIKTVHCMIKDSVFSRGTLLLADEMSGQTITAVNRVVLVKDTSNSIVFKLPFVFADLFGFSRLLSRLFRLDRLNLLYQDLENLVFLRYGRVYHYSRLDNLLTKCFKLSYTRNILVGASTIGPAGELIFGDYGAKGKSQGVVVYRSLDKGKYWEEIFKFPVGSVKQILAINWDRHSSSFWVNTGDEIGECFFWRFDKNFELVEKLGDGSLIYRAISIWFAKGKISWVSNNPVNGSKLYSLDLVNRDLEAGEDIDGSVWYSKTLSDGQVLLTTCAEDLGWKSDNGVKLLASKTTNNFRVIGYYPKDRFSKRLFRFGIGSFPLGDMSANKVFINLEAVEKYDGKIVMVDLDEG